MALVSFCSAKGAPGVSTLTLAVAYACSHQRSSIVVEADADGGTIAARLGIGYEPGMLDLATGFRRDLPDAEGVARFCQPLTDRLSVITGSGCADQMSDALGMSGAVVATALSAMPGLNVFADLGRVSARSPQLGFAARSAATVVIAPPTLEDVQTLPPRISALRRAGGNVMLVSVGDSPYNPADVAAQLAVPLLGTWVYDAEAAERMWTGGVDRRVIRSMWWRSTVWIAERITDLMIPHYAAPVSAVPAAAVPAVGDPGCTTHAAEIPLASAITPPIVATHGLMNGTAS